MKYRPGVKILFYTLLLCNIIKGQIPEEEKTWRRESSIPKSVDFSDIFKKDEVTREEFEKWQRDKEIKLRERISQVEALEQAIDPERYIVGPGDIFSFNIWGAMEMQIPITVSPEGKLLIPSVGEILVDGKRLVNVQALVLDKAAPYYEKSKISLNLEALRFFRVHIVGEVKYPGTYIAQAVDRISEVITEAGGVTEWAWKRKIELRHMNGSVNYFDLSSFEQEGNLEQDFFVNGGDVIYIPPINLGENLVKVEGDMEISGTYQIFIKEKLIDFLQRIRALRKNTDISKIVIIRNEKHSGIEIKRYINPFIENDLTYQNFSLKNGDRLIFPSYYVYVKGTVLNPGAYPYALNMKARDYAGMAGGDFRSGNIKGVKVYHVRTGKTEKGPDVLVEPGDVVHLNPSWSQRSENLFRLLSAIASLIIAAKAMGIFGK